MPFDNPTPKREPAPPARPQREDRAILFACGVCMRLRVDVWALAFVPDSFVVCPDSTLHACPWCEDACILAHVAPLREASER